MTWNRRPYPRDAALDERVDSILEPEPTTGCFLWPGYTVKGYGVVYWREEGRARSRGLYVHVLAYERAYGPVPPHLELDHLCRVKRCANERHLEAVTAATNLLRGNGISARHARKTCCPQGHDYVVRYERHGRVRRCLECHRLNQQRWRKGRKSV